jgi:hypothetical protein
MEMARGLDYTMEKVWKCGEGKSIILSWHWHYPLWLKARARLIPFHFPVASPLIHINNLSFYSIEIKV